MVKVFTVSDRHPRQANHEFTGSVQARYENRMAFRVSGKVLSRHVEIGDRVKVGQQLFELDPQDYELQKKSAEANLSVAKAAVQQSVAEEKRLAELRRTNAVSSSEYEKGLSDRDSALARLDGAQKQLELAENQLSYCHLTAAAAGVVTMIAAESGQVVAVGDVLCTIAQTDELEAMVELPENGLPQDPQMHASVRFWSQPDRVVRAQLRELSPSADPSTRTYRARFTLLDPVPSIQLGMTATVFWQPANASGAIAIPSISIIRSEGRPAVWRLSQSRESVTAVPIEILEFADPMVLVTRSSLNDGDQIVAAGAQKLDEHARVRPWENENRE